MGPAVGVVRRFFAIDGWTHGGLLAIELFTTVIPLMIIGFSYFSGFANNASFATILIEELNLNPSESAQVTALFGNAAGVKSTWTLFGLLGFLLWGIPMAITVAAMFARAWRREPFDFGGKLWRGGVWFVAYLATIAVQYKITWAGDHSGTTRWLLFACGLLPVWAFWILSPVLLVRNGAHGWRSLIYAGLAGVVVSGIALAISFRIVFPLLLDGWTGFGPIGVAMTIMTWCGVEGVAWVVVACTGAIIWELHAPADTVIGAQGSAGDASFDEVTM
jgi:hypothetical protein